MANASAEPHLQERFVSGKADRLVLPVADTPPPGAVCEPTLTLRFTLRDGRLTLRYDEGGCSFDERKAILTFKPWSRVA